MACRRVSNNSAGTVTKYAPPSYSLAQTISAPSGGYYVTMDASNDLFIARAGTSSVDYYPAPSYTTLTTIGTFTMTQSIAVDDASPAHLFVGDNGANTVFEYASPYSASSLSITSGVSGPIYEVVTP
jgi:hypothetical protein